MPNVFCFVFVIIYVMQVIFTYHKPLLNIKYNESIKPMKSLKVMDYYEAYLSYCSDLMCEEG